VVCAIQALALGDGGITTLGLGIVNLALVPAFVGYPLLLALRRLRPTPGGVAVAAGMCAWVCVVLAAALFSLEFALGGQVEVDTATVTAGVVGTYALIGIVEGVLTALILRALMGVRPDLVRAAAGIRRPVRRELEASAS
jgi:cobalt/nickel transport system permease protein